MEASYSVDRLFMGGGQLVEVLKGAGKDRGLASSLINLADLLYEGDDRRALGPWGRIWRPLSRHRLTGVLARAGP